LNYNFNEGGFFYTVLSTYEYEINAQASLCKKAPDSVSKSDLPTSQWALCARRVQKLCVVLMVAGHERLPLWDGALRGHLPEVRLCLQDWKE